jgi:hypothetical protein
MPILREYDPEQILHDQETRHRKTYRPARDEFDFIRERCVCVGILSLRERHSHVRCGRIDMALVITLTRGVRQAKVRVATHDRDAS